MVINIVKSIDCRTLEQKRIAMKLRNNNHESSPYKNIPLPEIQAILPHMIRKNTPVGMFKSRHKEYGKNK